MMTVVAVLPSGALLPESILHADSFKILATFVALNTLMYATLAVLKVLPKGYSLSWFSGFNRRAQNRSIHPEGHRHPAGDGCETSSRSPRSRPSAT